MFDKTQYELLDFGEGRKLERFGELILDRPTPAAAPFSRQYPDLWDRADAQYRALDSGTGHWKLARNASNTWEISHGNVTFELQCTKFGQIGLFAEQATNWDWIDRQTRRRARKPKILNLFAHTGASTLAAANAGADVTHVDGARGAVGWARRNASRSNLQDAPIRWIVEDVLTFVRRELRRKQQYDAVILDPPSYGHGPKGQIWKVTRDLFVLLKACASLTARSRSFVLLTCHSPGFGPAELEASLADGFFGSCQAGTTVGQLYLETAEGRKLPSGVVARWPGK